MSDWVKRLSQQEKCCLVKEVRAQRRGLDQRKRIMDRKLQIGMDRFTDVISTDETGPGGAHHEYRVTDKASRSTYANVSFQNGAIGESGGANGCHNRARVKFSR